MSVRRSCRLLPLLCLLLLPVSAVAQTQPSPPPSDQGPSNPDPSNPSPSAKPLGTTVTYLGNEGFLIERGEQRVVFDAFIATPYAGYDALSETAIEQLMAAETPFDDIDLALTSHVHQDHYQAEVGRRFRQQRPEVPWLAPPQVLESLALASSAEVPGKGELISSWPDEGEVVRWQDGSLKVEVLRLRHGGEQHREIQNLATVVDFAGVRVLHLGDAEDSLEVFEAYPELEVDIALVPFWYFLDPGGQQVIDQRIEARHWIAMHVPSTHVEFFREKIELLDRPVSLFAQRMDSLDL